MLNLEITNAFKKDLKVCRRRNWEINKLEAVIQKLQQEEDISAWKDHPLVGNWNGHRELHVESDWLLIYKVDQTQKALFLVRTGTHSDLF